MSSVSSNVPLQNEDLAQIDEESVEYLKIHEEQDNLIEQGIRLLTTKVLDLVTLAAKSFINLDLETEYTKQTH
jgi:hypothetical protein